MLRASNRKKKAEGGDLRSRGAVAGTILAKQDRPGSPSRQGGKAGITGGECLGVEFEPMDSSLVMPSDFSLGGEEVVLKPVSPDHAAGLFPLVHGREEVLRWLIWEGPGTPEELAESLTQWRNPSPHGEGAHLTILERGELERPVGTISLRFRSPGIGDIGYWLGPEMWGRGLATEAVRLLSSYALVERGAAALCAWVDVGNDASRRVLEKNGFLLERTVPGMAKKKSGPVDQWGFVLTIDQARRSPAGEDL